MTYLQWRHREAQAMKIREPVSKLLDDLSLTEARIWVQLREVGIDPFVVMGLEIPVLRNRLRETLGL